MRKFLSAMQKLFARIRVSKVGATIVWALSNIHYLWCKITCASIVAFVNLCDSRLEALALGPLQCSSSTDCSWKRWRHRRVVGRRTKLPSKCPKIGSCLCPRTAGFCPCWGRCLRIDKLQAKLVALIMACTQLAPREFKMQSLNLYFLLFRLDSKPYHLPSSARSINTFMNKLFLPSSVIWWRSDIFSCEISTWVMPDVRFVSSLAKASCFLCDSNCYHKQANLKHCMATSTRLFTLYNLILNITCTSV